MPSVLTLLTDFGWQDVYVGVMKGVIAGINPDLQVIDLTHEIPPQNISAGRFCLLNAYSYFPERTVHVAVVDPGVGSKRRGVAIEFAGGFLVGPDNGLFSGILSQRPIIAAVELTNSDYWLNNNPSQTFHGRDIFAPVGAYLASGVALSQMGKLIDPASLVSLPLPQLQITETTITGCIQYIDHFGNLITNIPAEIVNQSWSVKVKETVIAIAQTYSEVEQGAVVALIGSHNWLEIVVNQGDARQKLQLEWGDPITIFK
ncbi:MAG: SAM-dependent chlorinase/fluorinase [Stanieria sp.]